MAKKYPGLYLYFDWLKGLTQLPPEDSMRIIENLYHYAQDGIEPEPLENLAYTLLQNLYLDSMKRSQLCAESGRRGGLKTASKYAPVEDSVEDFYDDYITPAEELEALMREAEAINRRMSVLRAAASAGGADA